MPPTTTIPISEPSAPSITSTTAGDGEVAITWSEPSDGGSSITGYTVEYSSASNFASSTTANVSASPRQLTIGALSNGTSYYFRVLARNAVGSGSYSSSSGAVIPATSPGIPSNLQATETDSALALSWTAPSDGGSAIIDYLVQFSTTSTFSVYQSVTISGGATSATLTDLTNGTTYFFKVKARNALSSGANSSASSAYVPRASRTLSIDASSYSGTYSMASSPPTVTATASAGSGSKTYASATSSVCAVGSSTGLVSFVSVGICSLSATIAQDGALLAANSPPISFAVTLAAPAFTLSSSSESKAQNTAIVGYTVSSTGGAIASYSISPSAPAGTSFNTSTGLLSGTPTTVRSATVYTITATNATSSASQTFTLTVTTPASCADGGVCVLGNTGPGGGKVFYVAPTTFTCGANLELTCKYLEASPIAYNSETLVNGATSALACYETNSTTGTSDCRKNSIYSGSSQSSSRLSAYSIGSGLANTNQIYARLTTAGGSSSSTYAAGVAYDYSTTVSGTTFTDWYLPSENEIKEMCNNKSHIGNMPGADFWTSTEADADDFRHLSSGSCQFHTNNQSKSDRTRKVRPIRAFAPIP